MFGDKVDHLPNCCGLAAVPHRVVTRAGLNSMLGSVGQRPQHRGKTINLVLLTRTTHDGDDDDDDTKSSLSSEEDKDEEARLPKLVNPSRTAKQAGILKAIDTSGGRTERPAKRRRPSKPALPPARVPSPPPPAKNPELKRAEGGFRRISSDILDFAQHPSWYPPMTANPSDPFYTLFSKPFEMPPDRSLQGVRNTPGFGPQDLCDLHDCLNPLLTALKHGEKLIGQMVPPRGIPHSVAPNAPLAQPYADGPAPAEATSLPAANKACATEDSQSSDEGYSELPEDLE
ncbi:uncharacterized protein MELLADRAFT_110901 [Melampsora larici-populina 98AG31]|uniref:Uncharacterized protein n=1 Tax=Melampsora larici-populina (strain 98AG31 / pathotype 3-4-7) TaxID=747676 RepID=F4S1D3_MELLP|nr:uncharacterized protein MELLADRAFT_110901 [Melampsora larici-populina 98AG31]EGG01542.1 hypothetical protein MELLADRAFT_110901 [Melampsora larici-populina 98AG31]